METTKHGYEAVRVLFAALAAAERIKPVCEAQIDVDDFKVSIPVALEAGALFTSGSPHDGQSRCLAFAL